MRRQDTTRTLSADFDEEDEESEGGPVRSKIAAAVKEVALEVYKETRWQPAAILENLAWLQSRPRVMEELSPVQRRQASALRDRRLPDHPKTIQRWIKAAFPAEDTSDGWAFTEEVDTDPRVLSVLAAVIDRTEGRKQFLTQREASWVGSLAKVATGLEDWPLFRLATEYVYRRTHERDTRDLDAYLAYGPWRGTSDLNRYWGALALGYIPEPPLGLLYPDEFVEKMVELASPDFTTEELDIKGLRDGFRRLVYSMRSSEIPANGQMREFLYEHFVAMMVKLELFDHDEAAYITRRIEEELSSDNSMMRVFWNAALESGRSSKDALDLLFPVFEQAIRAEVAEMESALPPQMRRGR